MKRIKAMTISALALSTILIPLTAKAESSLKLGKIKSDQAIIITNKAMMSKKIAGSFANYTLYINDATTINGEKYFRVQTTENINNAIGYVRAKDLDIDAIKPLKVQNNIYTVQSASTKLYNTPNGTDQQVIDRVGKNEVLTVKKSIKVGNETFIYGQLKNGVTGWIQTSSDQLKRKPLPKPVVKKEAVANTPQVNAPGVQHQTVPTTLTDAANIQMKLSPKPQVSNGVKWTNARHSLVLRAMDTERLINDPIQKYQFLVLNQSQGLTAEQLNVLLQGKGILEGKGQAFKTASEKYHINEIYLISHAFLETAEGQSHLANGRHVKGEDPNKKFYNMYGVGAYDKDALKYGLKYAANVGWDTPEKAIIGGAEFISKGFVSENQNTLYTMRWNPFSPGDSQYATDIQWASANANYIAGFYNRLGISGNNFHFIHYTK